MKTERHVCQIFEALEDRQLLAAIAWDGGGGDNLWHNPLNWSGDVLPGLADDVTINNPYGATHFIQGAAAVRSLRTLTPFLLSNGLLKVNGDWNAGSALGISGGNLIGDGNLAISGTLEWWGGEISGPGKVQVLPGASAAVAGNVTLGRQLVNNGYFQWDSGEFLVNGGGILNLPGRTFEIQANGVLNSSPGLMLVNKGTLLKTSVESGATIAMPVHNQGVIEVRAGELRLSGPAVNVETGGILRGGVWSVVGASRLFLGTLITSVRASGALPVEVRLHGPGSQFAGLGDVSQFVASGANGASLRLTGGRAFSFPWLSSIPTLVVSNPGMTTTLTNALALGTLAVGAGTVSWSGGGQAGAIQITQGAELNLKGSTTIAHVSGLGLLRVTGETIWRTGTWSGGPTQVEAGGRLRIDAPTAAGDSGLKIMGRKLINYGDLWWLDDRGELRLGAEVVNRRNFMIFTPGFLSTTAGTGPGSAPAYITNHYIITKVGPFQTTLRAEGGGVRLANHGLVDVAEGTLIANGGGLSTGTFLTHAASEMVFGGLAATLDHATLAGAGRFRVANALTWNSPRDNMGPPEFGPRELRITSTGRLVLNGEGGITRSFIVNDGEMTLGAHARIYASGSILNNGRLNLTAADGLTVARDLILSATSVLSLRDSGLSEPVLMVYDSFLLGGRLVATIELVPGRVRPVWLFGAYGHVGAFASISWTGLPVGTTASLVYDPWSGYGPCTEVGRVLLSP